MAYRDRSFRVNENIMHEKMVRIVLTIFSWCARLNNKNPEMQ